MSRMRSSVSSSKYKRSHSSKSVLTVSGLWFTTTVRLPICLRVRMLDTAHQSNSTLLPGTQEEGKLSQHLLIMANTFACTGCRWAPRRARPWSSLLKLSYYWETRKYTHRPVLSWSLSQGGKMYTLMRKNTHTHTHIGWLLTDVIRTAA